MAEKRLNILTNLKDHPIDPPENSFEAIWNTLKIKDGVKDVFSGSPNSNNENADDTISENEIAAFKSLQDYAIAPPDFSSLDLDKTILPASSKKGAKIIGFNKYFLRIAAALIIVCFSTWAIYNVAANKKNETNSMANTEAVKNLPANNDQVNNNLPQPVNSTKKKDQSLVSVAKHNNNKSNTIIRDKKMNNAANASKERLIDNDIMFTLVSYQYKQYAPLMAQIASHKMIRLDQYSYVNVSDKMSEMLKQMYATKHNNKPTRKAKKLKAALLKWQKADEKNFDKSIKKNPADIIDLSEFILK